MAEITTNKTKLQPADLRRKLTLIKPDLE